MKKLNIQSCPICGGKHLTPSLTCVDHFATGEMFHLYRCEDCNFLFTQDAPCEEEMGRYYEAPTYISHSDTKKGLMNRIYHLVRQMMLQKKYKLIQSKCLPDERCLLDIGCGTGYFPAFMQKKGWKVTAIERSGQARSYAREHLHLDVLSDSQLSLLPAASFNVITLWHVMEHLQHLNETFEELHRLLAPNGMLVLALPNHTSYDAKKYGATWAAYDVPRHLWHFSPATIQKLASKHNFVMFEKFSMPFDAFYISMMTEKNSSSRFPMLKGGAVGLLGWMQSMIKKENSSSMIYLFRKK